MAFVPREYKSRPATAEEFAVAKTRGHLKGSVFEDIIRNLPIDEPQVFEFGEDRRAMNALFAGLNKYRRLHPEWRIELVTNTRRSSDQCRLFVCRGADYKEDTPEPYCVVPGCFDRASAGNERCASHIATKVFVSGGR